MLPEAKKMASRKHSHLQDNDFCTLLQFLSQGQELLELVFFSTFTQGVRQNSEGVPL